MGRFDSREAPAAFFDYGIFRDRYKGLPDAEVRKALAAEKERILLPEIVFSAHTEAFYRAIGLVTERERSAVAIGFEQGDLGGDQTTAWIAVELESKLEASARLTESWCDRLETAAAVCGFRQFRLWLIAPEGFSPEALEVIASRGGFGSSRRQADLLAAFLADEPPAETIEAEEYEITIPMSADAEMVSAHTIEDIARRHKIAAKDINQIKTALVEACINAVEHSHSPDRRIHQKFAVAPDRVTITVSNRGVRLADKVLSEIEPDEGRRGWGLKLMRNLMDDVRIEQADDGTRISMTKYLKRV
jgi:serine/threonine-protein kinase RsbW